MLFVVIGLAGDGVGAVIHLGPVFVKAFLLGRGEGCPPVLQCLREGDGIRVSQGGVPGIAVHPVQHIGGCLVVLQGAARRALPIAHSPLQRLGQRPGGILRRFLHGQIARSSRCGCRPAVPVPRTVCRRAQQGPQPQPGQKCRMLHGETPFFMLAVKTCQPMLCTTPAVCAGACCKNRQVL